MCLHVSAFPRPPPEVGPGRGFGDTQFLVEIRNAAARVNGWALPVVGPPI